MSTSVSKIYGDYLSEAPDSIHYPSPTIELESVREAKEFEVSAEIAAEELRFVQTRRPYFARILTENDK